MAKQPNRTQSGTNVQQVRQQNAQSQGAGGQFGTEFASETNAQEVRRQNQQSQSNKGQG
ncbi:gamma-type small acid-soluble spore protein [Fredinandcohnia sp. 179-A 10B2 NHS]|uniref:gamma-type small acid-soluble spore protein n=1 Tax=Fredinandcohnia sp. 179-A 10B2 NHS TaxID=3235176 RepID=UPI0039A0E147